MNLIQRNVDTNTKWLPKHRGDSNFEKEKGRNTIV